MENNKKRRFLVIDDDPINNHICRKYIKVNFPEAEIDTFTDPQAGLAHIRSRQMSAEDEKTILFLDINMPALSGWDVLQQFMTYPETIKDQFMTFMLSSSIAVDDKRKATNCDLVSGFIEKPLTNVHLHTLINDPHIQQAYLTARCA